MNSRWAHIWAALNSSYWFVPGTMILLAAALAGTMLLLDSRLAVRSEQVPWAYFGGAEEARLLLSTVASSVITVAGVVFSITIATLTQASSQFGPLLLRHFMRDSKNQFSLGVFAATFIYCLLVLRGTSGAAEGTVPNLAVAVAMLLAISCVLVLVFFIHHVARSLQAPQVIARVGADLEEALDRLFPGPMGCDGPPPAPGTVPEEETEQAGRPVTATRNGYIQAVDQERLLSMAHRYDLLIRMDRRPGDFIMINSPLLYVWFKEELPEDVPDQLRTVFFVGSQRTEEQDVEYCVNQMVALAVRALSPGINDPRTAVTCTDWLGAALCQVLRKGLPSPFRYDREGQLRIVTPATDFAGLADLAFNEIRQFGCSSVPVALHLLETIGEVGMHTDDPEIREVLLGHAEAVRQDSTAAIPNRRDQEDIRQRYELVRGILEAGPGRRAEVSEHEPFVPQRHSKNYDQ